MEIGSGIEAGQRLKGKSMFLIPFLSDAAQPNPLDCILHTSTIRYKIESKVVPVAGTIYLIKVRIKLLLNVGLATYFFNLKYKFFCCV